MYAFTKVQQLFSWTRKRCRYCREVRGSSGVLTGEAGEAENESTEGEWLRALRKWQWRRFIAFHILLKWACKRPVTQVTEWENQRMSLRVSHKHQIHPNPTMLRKTSKNNKCARAIGSFVVTTTWGSSLTLMEVGPNASAVAKLFLRLWF